jgi:hemerythrin-like domain-containing protein
MTAVESLTEEHGTILEVIGHLEHAADSVERGDPVDLRSVSDLVELCDLCVHTVHVTKEEQALFPLLASRGLGPDVTVVAALLAQHQTGGAFLRELRAAVTRTLAGDADARRDVVIWARDYAGLVREHIRIEDEYFYSLASQALRPEDDEALRGRFARIESSIVNRGERARCGELLGRLRGEPGRS